jgi:hypothetical protein
MSTSREELALQLTLKALENNLILQMYSPDKGPGEINSQTAYSVAEFYNNIFQALDKEI